MHKDGNNHKGKPRRPRRKVRRRKKAVQQRITQYMPLKRMEAEGPEPATRVDRLLGKRSGNQKEKEWGEEYTSEGELYFDKDQRRQAKIDFQIKPYYRKCTKFFSRFDFEGKPEDYLLLSRSFRCYQGGEQVQYGRMTREEVRDYLVLRVQMLEKDGEEGTKLKIRADRDGCGK